MEQLQLSISPAQMTKIRKGLPIQIKHGSMGNGNMTISLRPDKVKKMMSAFKRGKGLRIQMDEDEVRASGLIDGLKKLGRKVEKGVVNVGNKIATPIKKVIDKVPQPIRDVLQKEAQGLIDATGRTLGGMVSKVTGDDDLADMIEEGISGAGDELLSGKRLSLGSKILPIARQSVKVATDQIEDPQYRALVKALVKKSGAGLYGKAGQGLTGKGLSGSGLSGGRLSGFQNDFDLEDEDEDYRPRYTPLPSPIRKPAVMPRFKKGSQEAKDFMAMIREQKKGGNGINFKKIGRSFRKVGTDIGDDFKKVGRQTKTALFGKRIGDEAQFLLPILGGIGGTVAGSVGGVGGSAFGGAFGSAGGKALADEISKRGYGDPFANAQKGKKRVHGVRGRNPRIRPPPDLPTFSPYAQLASGQNNPFTPYSSFQNGGNGENNR